MSETRKENISNFERWATLYAQGGYSNRNRFNPIDTKDSVLVEMLDIFDSIKYSLLVIALKMKDENDDDNQPSS